MKLTSREKTMLIVLLIIAFFGLCYYFVFRPQLSRISDLTRQNSEYDVRIKDIDKELASGGMLDEQIASLKAQVSGRAVKFYPESMQDQLILTLDGLLTQYQLVSNSYAFGQMTINEAKPVNNDAAKAEAGKKKGLLAGEITQEYNSIPSIAAQANGGDGPQNAQEPQNSPSQQPGGQVEFMNVTLQFTGSYDGVMNFIKGLEALNKTIIINSLSVSKDQMGMSTANISMDFYAAPRLFDTGAAQ